MEHELKVWPAYFERLADGTKTFEIRRDDRGYQSGDKLVLREYVDVTFLGAPTAGRYTGRQLVRTIGFVAKGTLFGLALGAYAVLSLLPEPLSDDETMDGLREAAGWVVDERDQAEWALAEVLALLDRLDESGQDFDLDMIRQRIPADLRQRLAGSVAEVNADAESG